MKRYMIWATVLLTLCLMITGCNGGQETPEESEVPEGQPVLVQLMDPPVGTELVTMETSLGDITFMLFPDEAPWAVENFITQAKYGYYNGLQIDKVMNNCMIRGGDPTGTGMDIGKSVWPEYPTFAPEFSWNLWHFTGALAYYNHSVESGESENGSQFFIVSGDDLTPQQLEEMKDVFPDNVVAAYTEIGGQPGMDSHYTVFGQVVNGLSIVKDIAALETQILAPEGDITEPRNGVPVEDVIILGFTFETVGEEASSAS